MVRPILLASAAFVVLVGAAQACSSSDTGGGSGGSGGEGGDSSGGPSGQGPTTGSSSGGADCDKLCGKEKTAGCEAADCATDCKNGGGVPAACKSQFDALVACGAGAGTIMCAEGKPKVSGCDAEGGALLQCLSGGQGGAGQGGAGQGGSGVGGSGDCYAGKGACDPTVPGTCGAGEACDIGQSGFECFPPPNDAQIGGACDNSAGPYCTNGAACVMMVCAKYCCADAECSGKTCTSVGMSGTIDVKVCQ